MLVERASCLEDAVERAQATSSRQELPSGSCRLANACCESGAVDVGKSCLVARKVVKSGYNSAEMPRRRRNVREVEYFDSESSGSGSDASEASDTHAGSPVERPTDPSEVPMYVGDRSDAVGGTGMLTQASAGVMGPLQLLRPHHVPGGQTGSYPSGSSCLEDAACARSTTSSCLEDFTCNVFLFRQLYVQPNNFFQRQQHHFHNTH